MNLLPLEPAAEPRLGGSPVTFGAGLHTPKAATLIGFRPEDVQFKAGGPDDLTFRARVVALQPLGATMIVDLTTLGGDRPITAVTEWREETVPVNSEIDLTLRGRDLHYFNSETLERLAA
jgi:hypothetical protein